MTVIAGIGRSSRAQPVLEEAEALATTIGAELHLVHVVNSPEFVSLERSRIERDMSALSPQEIEALVREHIVDWADDVSMDFTPVGLIGNVGHELIEYADEVDASYIVIGGRKRTPVGKAVFGSKAQSIILDANCPVVSVPLRAE